MGLAEIRLPGVVIAEMYKALLVPVQHQMQEPESKATAAIPALQYLGKNSKQVAVLVHYPQQTYLPEEQLVFLSSVLKACGLTTDDIAIVNTAKQDVAFSALVAQLHPLCILQFGTASPDFLPPADYFTIDNTLGTAVMRIPGLETLNQSDTESRLLKSRLWLALKQLFRI